MTTSTISLIAQLQDGSSRPATADEIIAAARDHMSRRVRSGTPQSLRFAILLGGVGSCRGRRQRV
jgi:hypothetical protein